MQYCTPTSFRAASTRPFRWMSVAARTGLLILVLLTAVGLSSGQAWGQLTPLSDLVPLTELETPTDDLIRIATEYAEALREMKTAKLTADTLQRLSASAVITNLEIQIANVNVVTAESKVAILRAIAEKQLAAAEAKLKLLRDLQREANVRANAEVGTDNQLLVAQAEATIAILKMILAMK
jgi:hypothetical protein